MAANQSIPVETAMAGCPEYRRQLCADRLCIRPAGSSALLVLPKGECPLSGHAAPMVHKECTLVSVQARHVLLLAIRLGNGCDVHALYENSVGRVQGVGALLVGLKPEMCRREMVGLVGRDMETGAKWAFPPTLFLSVDLDHEVIVQNMKHTIAYFLERVCRHL